MKCACPELLIRWSTDAGDTVPLAFRLHKLTCSSGEPDDGRVRMAQNTLTNQPWEKYQDLSSFGVKVDPNLTSISIYFSGQ